MPKQHKTTMFKPWFLKCFLCDVLVIEIEATEPTLGHLQEPIGKGHCTDLLLAVTVRAPGKRGYEDIRKIDKDRFFMGMDGGISHL